MSDCQSLIQTTKQCPRRLGVLNVMQLVNQTKITVNIDNVSDLIDSGIK